MTIHPDLRQPLRKVGSILLGLVAVFVLAWTTMPLFAVPGIPVYAPLHTALEIFAIVIAMMVAGVCWGARSQHRAHNFTVLACIFLGVALLDFLHILSFPGMPDFGTPNNLNKTITFWLAGRLLAAFGLLAVTLRSWRARHDERAAALLLASVLLYVLLVGALVLGDTGWLPAVFVPGAGITRFKVGSEITIAVLYLAAAWRMLRQMREPQPYDAVGLFAAVCVMLLSELFFIVITNVSDLSTLLGHVYKVIAYAFIYQSLFIASVRAPYQRLLASQKVLEASSAAIRREQNFSTNALNSLPGIVYVVDQDGHFLRWNRNFEIASGYSAEEITGLRPAHFFRDADVALVAERSRQVFESGSSEAEAFFYARDGSRKPYFFTGQLLQHEGRPCLVGMGIDISERRRTEDLRHASESRYRLLFENNLDGVLQTRPGPNGSGGIILAANPAACQMFGLTEAELKHANRAQIADLTDPRLASLSAEREATGSSQGEVTMRRADGSFFEADIATSIYQDLDGQPTACIVIRDITERKQAESEMNKLAFYDPLTRLPNRRLLMDRMALALAKAKRTGGLGAVFFIDLDHFKNINDARGHATGDALLKDVAQRLSGLLREEDTVARIGGDEFVVLTGSLADKLESAAHTAMGIAEKIREALQLPFIIDGQPYSSGGSIGVTLMPKGEQTADDLLREADTAMYRAKSAGRNRIAFFEATMQSEVEQRFALEHDLAQAIPQGQLSMYLQPQVDLHGQPVGVELLMRWQHPTRGAISPAQFIPIAEQTGMILRMGDWALVEGCKTLVKMRDAGVLVPLSINVSPRQFHQHDFIERIEAILRETGAPGDYLVLEVTEGLLIDNLDDTIARMLQVAALGIRFSIDDFGTGYSSLAYLRRLPLYELKIDRSFVQDLPDSANGAAIVQAILAMARHLRLRVIAEGVETRAQAKFLGENGCDGLQGYLFARPMPIAQWLARAAAPMLATLK